jgi:hypothetical protein
MDVKEIPWPWSILSIFPGDTATRIIEFLTITADLVSTFSPSRPMSCFASLALQWAWRPSRRPIVREFLSS